MHRNFGVSVALAAALMCEMSTAMAGDYGGVALGRGTGPDGALLIAPGAAGLPGRSALVIGNPLLGPRTDFRNGPYGRPGHGYGGALYGTVPGGVYEIPSQDRMYCPESRAYFPAVQDCATPWLRMRPGGGVTADSPIPSPGGQNYGR